MTPLTTEQQLLAADPRAIAQAEHGAAYYARRFPVVSHDDWLSAAMLALVIAAGGFDGTGDFLGYARYVTKKQFCNVLRDWRPRGFRSGRRGLEPKVHLFSEITDAAAEWWSLRQQYEDSRHPGGWMTDPADPHDPSGFYEEMHEEIEAMLAALEPAQADTVRRLVLRAGNRQLEIAAADGVSRQAVEQRLRRALGHLAGIVAKRGVLV